MKVIFSFSNLKNNPYMSSQAVLDDKIYNFTIKWNDFAQCAYLYLYDAEMNPIVLGIALVNNLLIRADRRLLPQDLRFININGETYEPDLSNMEEFAFIYG